MRAERRRLGRSIRRGRRRARQGIREVTVTITPRTDFFLWELELLAPVFARELESSLEATAQTVKTLGAEVPRTSRPLIHNGRASRGRR